MDSWQINKVVYTNFIIDSNKLNGYQAIKNMEQDSMINGCKKNLSTILCSK